MTSPFDQSRYQVRFDWGLEGLDRLAPADIVVVVDVLRFSSTVAERVDAGERVPLDEHAHAVSANGAPIAAHAADRALSPPERDGAGGPPGATVLLGCLRNAGAVARAVLAEQHRRGGRTSIAVIAAGEAASRDPNSRLRFAVEDLLGAGAVISAISERGLDHTSPEAAAAVEAFRGLRQATRHLLGSSGSGLELADRDRRDEVAAASVVDDLASVPVLRDGVFDAY